MSEHSEGAEVIRAPGGAIIFGQPEAEYHASRAIGRTDLMKILASPAKYRAAQDAKQARQDRAEEEAGDE